MSEILSGLRNAIRRFITGATPYERAVEEFIRDLQRTLIKADVNVRLVFEISRRIKERAVKEKPPPGASRRDWFIKIVYEELVSLFGGEEEPDVIPNKTPYVIMMVGVQGSGKTTSAAKLAWYYRNRRFKVGLVAADTYRPGAYDQLRQLAESVGAMFYGEKDARDAVKLAETGVKKLVEEGAEIIIVDTAGRHGYGEEQSLLDEMKSIAEKVKPDEVMLVIDASMGQKARDLAEKFHSATPIGSIFLSKLDGTAKGGGALSAVAVTGARIKFVGTGEKPDEIEVFRPANFVARILGIGDIRSIIERLEALAETEELEKQAEEILSGRLNMRIIYKQIRQIRRLGPLSKVLKMLPGFGLTIPDIDEEARVSEKKMDAWMAIIQSMTYEELEKPELIEKEKSRIRRIAIGSGTRPEDVKELLTYYNQVKRMIKQLKRKKTLLKKYGKLDQQWLG